MEVQHFVPCRHPARPRPEPMLAFLLPPSFHSFPPPSPACPHPPPPQLPLRYGPGEQHSPAISSPAVSLLPSSFINYQSGNARRWRGASLPTQLAGPAVAEASSPRPCPPGGQLVPPPSPLPPVSRCGSSTSSEAIGKQRPEMRFSVSFPSLTNK